MSAGAQPGAIGEDSASIRAIAKRVGITASALRLIESMPSSIKKRAN